MGSDSHRNHIAHQLESFVQARHIQWATRGVVSKIVVPAISLPKHVHRLHAGQICSSASGWRLVVVTWLVSHMNVVPFMVSIRVQPILVQPIRVQPILVQPWPCAIKLSMTIAWPLNIQTLLGLLIDVVVSYDIPWLIRRTQLDKQWVKCSRYISHFSPKIVYVEHVTNACWIKVLGNTYSIQSF